MSNDNDDTYPFQCLSQEARELYLENRISRIKVPSPLVFYRDYVSRNKPVIIQGALDQWSCFIQMTKSEYLTKTILVIHR
jgi:hypothetical protein